MSTFKSRRPTNIELPEYSLVPTLKKLDDLDAFSKKLRKLLQACETEKSLLKFEIAKLNKKVTRIANEKRDAESQLYMTTMSGKKKKTRKSKRKAGGTIPPLTHKERKAKFKEYITNIYNRNLDVSEIISLISKTGFNDKDYSIMTLGILQFVRDWSDNLDLIITDDYIKEKLEQAKNIHEATGSSPSTAAMGRTKSKKSKLKKSKSKKSKKKL
tara:strand:+ start:99 stop:740 length:642 start_codon:yes stop_codon:yes gene_type:complete